MPARAMGRRRGSSGQMTFWCWKKREDLEEQCGHLRCKNDPLARCSYDYLMNVAATCTNSDLARHAEMTLRKRYPSKIKIRNKKPPRLRPGRRSA